MCLKGGRYLKNKRLFYGILFAVLVITEVVIGVFVHDGFVRPYLGDVIVVIAIYALVRIIIPEKYSFLPLAVFIFAVIVELLQGVHIADILGVKNAVLRAIIGTSFDRKDIICYAAGCILLGIYEIISRKNKK